MPILASFDRLDALFPAHVAKPPSELSPTAVPGTSDAAAHALASCLKENHINFHCFFNEKRYHNHLAHHLFAAYKLGATPTLIQAAYNEHAGDQRPAFPSPGRIDESNWKQHLGDDEYYAAYIDFFADHVLKHGAASALSKYVFHTDANWGPETDASKAPRMLDRFFAGLVHPLIHYGHGAEFGVPGMAAEGLAWTAVHRPSAESLLPAEFFAPPTTDTTMSRLAQTLWISSPPSNTSAHSFTILARLLKDSRFAPGVVDADGNDELVNTLKNQGNLLYEYAKQWDCDISTPDKLSSRIEELSWLAALTYGVGGWNASRGFIADFFLMHLVTSSLFIPSIIAQLDKTGQSALLRAYAATTFAVWVSRGRPSFQIKAFYENVSTTILPPLDAPKPSAECLDKDHSTQNPWLALLQSTVSHPDEHLLKTERALAHYASLYGDRPKGHWGGTELEGAEELDGSLFVRVAGLSLKRLGAVREGEERGHWDTVGFFDQA